MAEEEEKEKKKKNKTCKDVCTVCCCCALYGNWQEGEDSWYCCHRWCYFEANEDTPSDIDFFWIWYWPWVCCCVHCCGDKA